MSSSSINTVRLLSHLRVRPFSAPPISQVIFDILLKLQEVVRFSIREFDNVGGTEIRREAAAHSSIIIIIIQCRVSILHIATPGWDTTPSLVTIWVKGDAYLARLQAGLNLCVCMWRSRSYQSG